MGIAEELLRIGTQVAIRQITAPQQWGRRIAGAIACLLLAALIAMAALAAAVAALGLWLAPKLGAALACLVCTGVLLLLSVILLLVAKAITSRRRASGPNLGALAAVAEQSGRELRAAFDRNIPSMLIAALVGGVIAGLRTKRRRSG
jgi:hypothetical protein